jgi:hypothetical protein
MSKTGSPARIDRLEL